MNLRHFVKHNYHDHGTEKDIDSIIKFDTKVAAETKNGSKEIQKPGSGGVLVTFPMKLHTLLDQIKLDGLAHIISWAPHGRAFIIHDKNNFVGDVMPKYFRQTKITSFQRQLNL